MDHQMKSGIYGVAFSGPHSVVATGVCYVNSGKMLGGDAGYAYYGDYAVEGSTVRATLDLLQHTIGQPSAFGDAVERLSLTVEGTVDADRRGLRGAVTGRSGVIFTIRGRRVGDLPPCPGIC
jgi:hypothetical protein